MCYYLDCNVLRWFRLRKLQERRKRLQVRQGPRVVMWGLLGISAAITPILGFPIESDKWNVVLLVLWSSVIGWPVTFYWSKALHDRLPVLRKRLNKRQKHGQWEIEDSPPDRVLWLPAWLGIFERALFSILIGLNIAGGAGFIGAWVGFKLAGGWKTWSKGTTYTSALFMIGLLGNIMSVAFGVIAGLMIRSLKS